MTITSKDQRIAQLERLLVDIGFLLMEEVPYNVAPHLRAELVQATKEMLEQGATLPGLVSKATTHLISKKAHQGAPYPTLVKNSEHGPKAMPPEQLGRIAFDAHEAYWDEKGINPQSWEIQGGVEHDGWIATALAVVGHVFSSRPPMILYLEGEISFRKFCRMCGMEEGEGKEAVALWLARAIERSGQAENVIAEWMATPATPALALIEEEEEALPVAA